MWHRQLLAALVVWPILYPFSTYLLPVAALVHTQRFTQGSTGHVRAAAAGATAACARKAGYTLATPNLR